MFNFLCFVCFPTAILFNFMKMSINLVLFVQKSSMNFNEKCDKVNIRVVQQFSSNISSCDETKRGRALGGMNE